MRLFLSITYLLAIVLSAACSVDYSNIPDDKTYRGDPYVTLIGVIASVSLSNTVGDDPARQLTNQLSISKTLSRDLRVTLEIEPTETNGQVGTNFDFQKEVTIKAGENYGTYTVQALDINNDNYQDYTLALKIVATDHPNVIPGLYGLKKELENRKKRFKSFTFAP